MTAEEIREEILDSPKFDFKHRDYAYYFKMVSTVEINGTILISTGVILMEKDEIRFVDCNRTNAIVDYNVIGSIRIY